MEYRLRFVTDAGPVPFGAADYMIGGKRYATPAPGRKFRSLFTVLKHTRDVVNTSGDVGRTLGVFVQMRLAPSAPWIAISAKDTDRYAQEMNIKNWQRLHEPAPRHA
jgi:hypothetical protein